MTHEEPLRLRALLSRQNTHEGTMTLDQSEPRGGSDVHLLAAITFSSLQ